jgi:hypothetical protein
MWETLFKWDYTGLYIFLNIFSPSIFSKHQSL